jgi:hypothetical protein
LAVSKYVGQILPEPIAGMVGPAGQQKRWIIIPWRLANSKADKNRLADPFGRKDFAHGLIKIIKKSHWRRWATDIGWGFQQFNFAAFQIPSRIWALFNLLGLAFNYVHCFI